MSTLEKAICRPAVFPFFAEREQWPPDTLAGIYRKLVGQDLLADLFHEKHVDEEEFCRFMAEDVLSYLFMDLETKQITGIGWFDNIEEGDCIRKARGSFCFFKDFWYQEVTQAFGSIFLSHGYNFLEYDLIYGITPSSNKLAQRAIKKMGFTYVATVPNFCSRRGELTDGMICTMTRDQFNAKLPTVEV